MKETKIDITKPIEIIFNNKLKIMFITIVCMLFGYIFFYTGQKEGKTIYKIETNILPITIFEEYDYELYNTLLEKEKIFIKGPFKKITINYLEELFFSKLKYDSKDIFFNALKNTSIIKREDFDDEQQYIIAINKFIEKIVIEKLNSSPENFFNKNNINITFTSEINDRQLFSQFLSEVETVINSEIQKFIFENFENLMKIEKNIINNFDLYSIDNNLLIKSLSTGVNLKELLKNTSDLIDNTSIYRAQKKEIISLLDEFFKSTYRARKKEIISLLDEFFKSTEIANSSKKFFAARFDKMNKLNISEYSKEETLRVGQILTISALGGLVFGSIFVLLVNLSLKKKKRLIL